ncbi:hypothetical protein DFH09DRAFT_1312168 [Mycena vulgaris]|nr:hypothetical protein DFH09DRAFT_1312168 [Mycena vulgaris]
MPIVSCIAQAVAVAVAEDDGRKTLPLSDLRHFEAHEFNGLLGANFADIVPLMALPSLRTLRMTWNQDDLEGFELPACGLTAQITLGDQVYDVSNPFWEVTCPIKHDNNCQRSRHDFVYSRMAPSRGWKWQTEHGRTTIQQIVAMKIPQWTGGHRDWQVTEHGRTTIQQIVAMKIPQWTGGHRDWQVTVIAWILDGEDVLCITAMGDGKSALFAVPIIVLLEVAKSPAMYPGFGDQKRKTPAGLVIAPTKGLSANIECDLIYTFPRASFLTVYNYKIFELQALGIPALACTREALVIYRADVGGTRPEGSGPGTEPETG